MSWDDSKARKMTTTMTTMTMMMTTTIHHRNRAASHPDHRNLHKAPCRERVTLNLTHPPPPINGTMIETGRTDERETCPLCMADRLVRETTNVAA
jgi:hypothetical protein